MQFYLIYMFTWTEPNLADVKILIFGDLKGSHRPKYKMPMDYRISYLNSSLTNDWYG